MRGFSKVMLLMATMFSLSVNIVGAEEREIIVRLDQHRALFSEQQPTMIDGHVFVPLRELFEGFNAKVQWDNQTQMVSVDKDDRHVQFKIGSNTATINNQTIALDAEPQVINGHTMVPLRFVSESLGYYVEWDDQYQTANIYTPIKKADKIPIDNNFLDKASNGILGDADFAIGTDENELLTKKGEPLSRINWDGGEALKYSNVVYFVDGKKITSIGIPGQRFGLNFEQIKEIIGNPDYEGSGDSLGGYILNYKAGNYDVYFIGSSKDSPIDSIRLFSHH